VPLQLVPSTALPAVEHTAVPVRQSYVFFTQGALGSEQSAPASHATQEPDLHTKPVVDPHGVPSLKGVVALQTAPASPHV
jgi:hypothetical protein